MSINDNFFDPNDVISTTNVENGIPEYTTFIPYVELYVVRHDKVEQLINDGGTITNPVLDATTVNFLGFDTKKGYYSTNYTDELVGEGVRNNVDEGFGITDISYDMKSKFVPTVEIKFTDIKGSSLFNPQQRLVSDISTTGSKYAIIFDFPPPTFILVLKGVYGKAVKVTLHLLKVDSAYDSNSGNFNITAKFVGKTFAPLSDIKMGWIKAAPYIGEPDRKVSGDVSKSISTLFELKLAGEQLYDKLNKLVTSSNEQEKIENINDSQTQITSLIESIKDVEYDKSVNLILPLDNTQPIQGIPFENRFGYPTKTISGRITLDNKKFYYLKIPTTNTETINSVISSLSRHKTNLINSEYKKLIKNYSNTDINIYQLFNVTASNEDDLNNVVIYFEYTNYTQKLIDKRNNLKVDKKEQRDSILVKVEDIARDELGFQPTIYNITKILTDDIDIFFNKLKNAGDTSRTGVKTGIKNLSVLTDGAFPVVTKLQMNDNGQTTPVNVYPGSEDILEINPSFKEWKEVQFVENFTRAYFEQKFQEEELEEIKKLSDDGSLKLIPISPLEVINGEMVELSYNNKNNLDDFFLTLFKRYFISTQYTYKGFWGRTYTESRRLDLNTFLAKSESQNITASPLHESIIDKILTFFEKEISGENILTKLQDFFRDKPEYVKTYQFLNVMVDKNSYILNENNTIFSFKDNDNYVGLSNYSNFNPETDLLNPNSLESSEKPTQYLLDFVKGSFISDFFKNEGEKPILTNTNLLYFQDARYKENKYDSDFYFIPYEGGNDLVENIYNSVMVSKPSINPRKISTITELEKIIFTYSALFISESVRDKFYYNGIYQLPNFFLANNGSQIKKDNGYSLLSKKDNEFVVSYYDDFVLNSSKLIDSYNQVFASSNPTIEDLRNSDLIEYILKMNTIINNTSFTFLDKDEIETIKEFKMDKFYPLFQKESDNTYTEDNIPFDTDIFGDPENQTRFDNYIGILKTNLLPALRDKKQKKDNKQKDLKKSLRDGDLKTQLYYSFKTVYDRWIKGGENLQNTQYGYPFSEGKPLINKFKFVDRGYNDISDIAIVDFSNIIDYLTNGPDTEVYGAISTFLAKNNFDFFPLQNFIDFETDSESWKELFNPQEDALIKTQPTFTCMYVGGYSSQSDDTVNLNDPSTIPQDMGDNVFGFNINVGTQNQTIFKDIQLSTSEFKETGESLKMMDNIFNNIGANNTPTPKGQNLFEVYQNRSYTCKVSIPFGNMLIQPTQYFELFNIPMFNGLYIILEVSHKMSASNNRLETTFLGSRIRRYISPIVTKPIVDMLGIFSELTEFTNLEEDNSSNTALGSLGIKTDTVNVIKATDILIRKQDRLSNNVIRDSNGNYINDNRHLTFTQQTIDRSKVKLTGVIKK